MRRAALLQLHEVRKLRLLVHRSSGSLEEIIAVRPRALLARRDSIPVDEQIVEALLPPNPSCDLRDESTTLASPLGPVHMHHCERHHPSTSNETLSARAF